MVEKVTGEHECVRQSIYNMNLIHTNYSILLLPLSHYNLTCDTHIHSQQQCKFDDNNKHGIIDCRQKKGTFLSSKFSKFLMIIVTIYFRSYNQKDTKI